LILPFLLSGCSNDKPKKVAEHPKVKLREIKSHGGFIVHYNCDSVPFLKKQVGDTVKIWTESNKTAAEISELDKYVSDKNYGKTLYIDAMYGGQIIVSEMRETIFIYRNDSLYEIAEQKPKLIFHPNMFETKDKVKLNKGSNYMEDEIVLEKQWIEEGKKCYTILINNVDSGENTSYAFTFDENLRFLLWENCKDTTRSSHI